MSYLKLTVLSEFFPVFSTLFYVSHFAHLTEQAEQVDRPTDKCVISVLGEGWGGGGARKDQKRPLTRVLGCRAHRHRHRRRPPPVFLRSLLLTQRNLSKGMRI